MRTRLTLTAILLLLLAQASSAAGPDHHCEPLDDAPLRMTEDSDRYDTQLPSGARIIITRRLTECAKTKGWLQPLVPVAGIRPATELDVLEAMGDPDVLLVDMRSENWFAARTIPGSVNIPYTEIAMRLEDLGCVAVSGGLDCSQARTVLGFCNGPTCPQSPIGMRAMVDEGYPPEKILYYRGGMLDWDALGLTTAPGEDTF